MSESISLSVPLIPLIHISHLLLAMPLTPISLLSLFLFLLLLQPLTTLSSIQDLLQSHGLPGGLFPNNVRSYNLDQYGRLEVCLDSPCMAKYETRVFFKSVVRANLSYGGLTGLEGLSQEELFLWLPIKDIMVNDPSSGLILFDIGLAYKQLSLSLFEDPPYCKPQGILAKRGNIGRKKMGSPKPGNAEMAQPGKFLGAFL